MESEIVLVKSNSVAIDLLACKESQDTTQKCRKVLAPDYVLDFGYVIPGQVLTGVLNVTNSGSVPLSLSANTKFLSGTGFSVDFERVNNLPCGVTHAFTVKFNAQISKLKMGQNCVLMPIQTSHGGQLQVQLCAVVTQPTIAASTDTLTFDTLKCGTCQIKTIELINNGPVTCHWTMAEEVKPLKKVDKFLPFYKRKKQQPRKAVFMVIPSSGMLSSGEQINVQIKFCPAEGVVYSRRLIICVADSTQQIFLTAYGEAEEPQLQFCPSVLDLGAWLPASTEAEAEVTVKNPCSFAIEFYSLELDKQYLEEEKMLQMMQGYDENNELLFSPIHPGQSLPKEVLEHYQECCCPLKEENLDGSADNRQKMDDLSDHVNEPENTALRQGLSSNMLGHQQSIPGTKDNFAHKHRGIAIIVYGAPLTDTSSVAVAMADHYGGICLSIDSVVTDVLINGISPVSLYARKLYDSAADKFNEKKPVEAVQANEGPTQPEPDADCQTMSTGTSHDAEGVLPLPGRNIDKDHSKAHQKDTNTSLQFHLESKVPLSDILPQDLLADILFERFQQNDCCHGIVIDGLSSVFTCSITATLQVALKALNTYKHICIINLYDTYSELKAREAAQRRAEEAIHKEEAEKELQWLQSLDDDQCQDLPNEMKKRIIQQHVVKLRQKKLRDIEINTKDGEEKKEQQQIKNLKEELLKTKKAGKKDTKELTKKSMMELKESTNAQTMSPHNSKEYLQHSGESSHSSEALGPAAPVQPVKEADHLKKQTEETKPGQEDKPGEVDERQSQFTAYQKSCEEVKHILQHWDLARGLLLVPIPDREASLMPHDGTTKKQLPKNTSKNKEKSMSAESSKTSNSSIDTEKAVIIPYIVINVIEDHLKLDELLKNRSLPALDQIVDDMQIEPVRTPTPPSTIFSIVPFPKERDNVGKLTCDCFTFLSRTSPVDLVEKENDSVDKAQTSDKAVAVPLKSPGKGNTKENMTTKEQDKKGRESRNKKRLMQRVSSLVDIIEPTTSTDHHSSALDQKWKRRLTKYRWIVPANGEVVLKIWFYSELPGTFSQTFNFELMGTKRLYQLLCTGISTYPSICNNYMTLFPICKKVGHMLEKVQKAYVTDPGYFEFGPLLCSKTRDRYRENRYPENTEKVVIHNNSSLQAEVQFRFKEDNHGTTFLLDPPAMSLKPDQKQELTVWAYPTKVGQMKDCIICSVRDSSEHFSIDLSCWGVQPELNLESKHFHFDRVILLRENTQTILLHNKAALPVSWRLYGTDDLGDEFSMPQNDGIIAASSSFPLSLNFKARRPLHIRKILRLEVSDVEKILGILQSENLLVTAEAYDVALEISPDGCLNFGTLKVFEENKLILKIKNQGKYDIAYKFLIQQTAPTLPGLASVFSVCPQSGTLKTHDKPTTLHILCRPNAEFSIKEQPVLSCQVVEPKLGDGGEVIAIVAINVSVTSVFSRYKITPVCDLNFGPLSYGCKKSQSFTIENTGVMETRFKISSMVGSAATGKKIPLENKSEKSTGQGGKPRRDSIPKDSKSAQFCLSMGIFSVSPGVGVLQPGSQQVVTVHCTAEQLGVWNQGLLIDISDRDPSDHTDGIPYRLLAEVCKPSIVSDTGSIFEEHYICCNKRELSSEPFCSAECLYIQEENQFIFQKVMVGHSVQAHFKLSNNTKISCMLSLAIRSAGAKERQMSQSTEVFELSSSTLLIPNQSHSFVSVTFTPQMMQFYSSVFEATLEQNTRLTPTSKTKVLEFHLTGEGILPHVTVLCPTVKNSTGSPLMHFRRVSVGPRHTLPLVLINNGYFPVQAQLDMLDEHDMFTLNPCPGNTCNFIYSTSSEITTDSVVSSVRMSLDVNEQVRLEVSFCTNKPVTAKTKILMCLEDNKHLITTIQVIGEACQEIVSFHDIKKSSQEIYLDVDEDDCKVLSFGSCYVGRLYRQNFLITNHSSSRVFKFEWPPAGPQVCFSPQVGHLHAGCSKEVTITFSSTEPVRLRNKLMKCVLCEVAFEQPVKDVADWDDRQKSLQWLNSSPHSASTTQQDISTKVMTTDEPEPSCSVVEGSQWMMSLCVSAVCDYVTYSCSTDSIHFEDTMLYQSRHQQFQIMNNGIVKVEFSFQLFMDPSNNHEEVNPELLPISIEPRAGVIEAGKMLTFNVSFSPVKVADFQGRLVCSISNLQEGVQAPCVWVSGRSLLPLCHFYLEDSDYISRSSSNPEFTGHLDANTRVIEFNTIAFVPSTRSFDILNPTKDSYSFKWKCEDSVWSPFHCLNPCGTIQPGKTVQACFEYISEKRNVVHSSWSFVIDSLSFSVPFLCVGITREPQLYFSKHPLDFGELPIGCKSQQIVDLVNREEETFHFTVMQSSLLCDDQQSSLKLEPMAGVILPKDRLSLSVKFHPCCKGQKRFRLVLRIKKKPEPLVLMVKANCYSMDTSLQVKMPDGVFMPINPDQEQPLDFGEVEVSEQSFLYFLLTNQSKFSMDVNFELRGNINLLQHLKADPQNAVIDVGNHLQTSLVFSPKGICNLQDVKMRIKVKLGPTYTFAIKGQSSAPSLDFSFSRHNFGKCLLYRPGMVPASFTLVISNKGKKDVSLHCQFRNTPHMKLDFGTNVLSPGTVLDVPIHFLPRELCTYHERVTFTLNSCITKEVSVLGQGVKMRLEVVDPRQRNLNLGCLNAGQKLKKKVKLVNHSTIDLSFKLLLNTQLDQRDLSLSQMGELNLRASDGSCFVEILFSPHQRIPAFTAELLAQCAGVFYPLLTLQGSCLGLEVQLDQDHLAFGAVVQHCQTTKKIILMNTGDVGTSFCWKTKKSAVGFSITPIKGFIRPGMEIPLDVTFAPLILSEDIRSEVSCAVGSSAVVKLTVTGSCIRASTKEVVQFACPVRRSHTQVLQVTNPTYQQCRIKPVLKGEQWSVAPYLDLESLQTKPVDLTYEPMTMTADGAKDLGSIFFYFPDGSGTMFNLQGTAEPPRVEDTIVCQLPAKTRHTVVLFVHNWLPKKQQFRVLMEILKPDKPDATVSITGLPFIDVPALAKKEYKMCFFAYREGQYHIKVTFQNATSGEYLFYLVTFESLPAGPLSTLELVATVREKVSATVTVENPLSKAICLTMECKCPEISVPPQHTVPRESKGSVSFEYRPLHERPSTVRLTLHSIDLGHFHYDLSLRALPPPPEKIIHFNTALGRSHVELVNFINYSYVKTEYSCSTDSPDFTVDQTVTASPGYRQPSEAAVSVCFEPHQPGEVRGLLTLSSEIGGKYTFVLCGTCIPPQPQGPFTIKPGRSINIPFKNVFLQSTTFSFQMNNPCFVVKGFNSVIGSKKTENITVSFEVPAEDHPGVWFGMLTISCQAPDSHSIPFFWDFYLQGSGPEPS